MGELAIDEPSARPGRSAAGGLALTVVSWVITIITLLVLDDLVFGPIFWTIGAFWGRLVAAAIAFAVYVPVQVWLVRRGTAEHPGRIAAWFLRRLSLDRPGGWMRQREDEIRSQVLGGGSAIALSPVLGGVIPPMLLWHRGHRTEFVRRISIVTSTIYAAEFALLHGWIAGSVAR